MKNTPFFKQVKKVLSLQRQYFTEQGKARKTRNTEDFEHAKVLLQGSKEAEGELRGIIKVIENQADTHDIFVTTLQLGFLQQAGVKRVGQPRVHNESLVLVTLEKDSEVDAPEDTVMRALWKVIDHARTRIILANQ